jgi:hypothetical protein
MIDRHRAFVTIALAALALFTSGARAETFFPVYGGKGDYTEQYRCPKGQVIVGFSGKTGDWVDRISLTCGRFVAPSYYQRRSQTNQYLNGTQQLLVGNRLFLLPAI